jgi:hypothetical protein
MHENRAEGLFSLLKPYLKGGKSSEKSDVALFPHSKPSLLPRLAAMPDVMAIKAASLDEPARFKPTMNIYLSSAQPWAPVAQWLQNFEKIDRESPF